MTDFISMLFGSGDELTVMQMCSRGIAVFFITLLLIRISGRRSFGIRTALDNIIVILLGAILSRAVVGASPFLPVICTAAVLVLIHRLLAGLLVQNPGFAKFMQGSKILLYDEHGFNRENMQKGLVCEEDIMQGVRKSALTEDLANIKTVYIERNGEISAIKK